MALPWDALFLAGFTYSGYRTLGRWLKYTDDTAKAQTDNAYLEGFDAYLQQSATAGERDKATPGAGAEASGQGHLWRDWSSMKTKQRLALLGEMWQVLAWTGQEAKFRLLAKHKGKSWAQLPHGAKKTLLAAADALDWSFLQDMEQEGGAIANATRLWQITEALPLLSAEPMLAESLLEEAKALQELVASADLAVNALLTGQQEKAIAALEPAQQLHVIEAKKKVDLLREAAQGGLGLGSGGKMARGQQLLELLRNFSLDPEDPASQEAKAAAAAELDAAADEAVSSLKAQHKSALAAAVATARNQAMTAALSAKISYSPGKPPLSNATAVGIINVASDEVTTALASISSDEGGSLQAKRAAAEALMAMASIVDSTAAALAAAQEEGEAAAAEEGAESVQQQLCRAAERLQDAAIKAAEQKLRSESAAAAKPTASEGEESENGAAAAEDQAAAAVAAVEEALAAVKEAVQKLPVTAEPAAEGQEQDSTTAPESVEEEIRSKVDEQVKAAEEKTSSQQQTALQSARSRERMALLLGKSKKLMTPPAAAPPAAEGEGEQAPPAEATLSTGERLQVGQEYLRQLGTRPLAAALMDLDKIAAANQAGSSDTASSGLEGLASSQQLTEDSQAKLSKLGELLAEIELADSIMKLELGPSVTSTIDKLDHYLARLQEKHKAAAQQDGEDSAEVAAASNTPRSPGGVSLNLLKEKEAAERCGAVVKELRQDGLVVLGLTAAQYRQLASFKEAAGSIKLEMDGLKYDRCVTALKDVAAQLGPIGAAIQVKLASCEDEETRSLMSQQKSLAVDLYKNLQEFLHFENNIRGPLKNCLRELNSLAGGIGAPRTTSGCAAATLKAEMAAEEAQKLQDLLSQMKGSDEPLAEGVAPEPDSVVATQGIVSTLQGSVEALQSALDDLAAHVTLRTRAANPEVAAAAAAAGLESADLPELNTLEQMEPELDHPLTLLSDATAEQQEEWERLGFEHVARGRVATVLLATATIDSHPGDQASKAAAAGTARGHGVPRVSVAVEGLPSGKSILQLAAERILRLQQLAAQETFGRHSPVTRLVQWYIMTSPATHSQLEQLLVDHNYFGLNSSQVHLFECTVAPPAFTGEPLKVITLGSATFTRGTPGSGEVFATLKKTGALRHMRRSGIRHVEVNAVDDNVLWRPADPFFIGFAAANGIDAAAKVMDPADVAAAYAAAMSGGSSSNSADGNGDAQHDPQQLLDESIGFLAAGVGSYYFSFSALSAAAGFYDSNALAMYRLVPVSKLPSKAPPPAMSVNLPPNATQAQRMQARQAMVAAQQAAAAAPPKPVEGYVPMRVLSDVFATGCDPASPSFGATGADLAGPTSSPLHGFKLAYLGVSKGEEFSPLFGAGPHFVVPEPDLAAADLLGLSTMWVEHSGAVVECEEGVEVSPLVSYAGEGLEALAGEGAVFSEPYDLALQGATSQGKVKHNAGGWALPVAIAYVVGAGLAVGKQFVAKN